MPRPGHEPPGPRQRVTTGGPAPGDGARVVPSPSRRRPSTPDVDPADAGRHRRGVAPPAERLLPPGGAAARERAAPAAQERPVPGGAPAPPRPGGEADDEGAPSRRPRSVVLRRPGATVVALLVAAVLAAALAAVFRGEAEALRGGVSPGGSALVDAAATRQVVDETTMALEAVYSYDPARLDVDEAEGARFTTGAFAADYTTLLAQVRAQPPAEQARVDARVRGSAVRRLEGDRAELVVYLDRTSPRLPTAEGIAATLVAQRVDGSWRIADLALLG